MMEQIVRGYRPEADGRCPDEAWEHQLGSLATEDLLAIRDQVRTLMEHVTAELTPEQMRVGGLLAAEGLLRRFRQPDASV